MIWFLLSLPPLAGALAYGRAPFFAWVVAGFLWLAGFAYAAGWSAGLTLLLLVLYSAAMAALSQAHAASRSRSALSAGRTVARPAMVTGYQSTRLVGCGP